MEIPRAKLKQVYKKSNMPGLLKKLYNVDLGHLNNQQLIFKWKPSDLIQLQIKPNKNSPGNVIMSHKILTN